MTIWDRPHSSVSALRLGSIELRDLLSRELDKANVVVDEWDFGRENQGRKHRRSRNKSDAATRENYRRGG